MKVGSPRLGQEQVEEANELFAEGLKLAERIDHKELIAVALEGSAAATVGGGDIIGAASMLNAADELRERSGLAREFFERGVYGQTLRRVQAGGSEEQARLAE